MKQLLLSTALVTAGALAAVAQQTDLTQPETDPPGAELMVPAPPPGAQDPMAPAAAPPTDVAEEAPAAPVAVAATTATELTGAQIVDTAGETIGSVSDLVIAPEGQITEVIVSVGGFLGLGAHSVAVPMSDIEIVRTATGGDLQLVVPMTREALEAAPPYQG